MGVNRDVTARVDVLATIAAGYVAGLLLAGPRRRGSSVLDHSQSRSEIARVAARSATATAKIGPRLVSLIGFFAQRSS